MKLAIASTTLLFAMMAAQAAVLSTTSSTGVNLVKRAPTSDDETDVEQSDMAGQSSLDQAPQLPFSKHEEEEIERLCDMAHKEMLRSMPSLFNRLDEVKEYKFFRERLQREREEKTPSELIELNERIATVEEILTDLEKELKMKSEEHNQQAIKYRDIKYARLSQRYDYLRKKYLQNHSGERLISVL